MSEIGDELRKVADEWDVTPLYAIADRVDAEMVELPRDANDELIHLGDAVYLTDEPETRYEVQWIDLHLDRRTTIGVESNGINTYRWPEYLTHERPDSLGRIADELEELASRALIKGGNGEEAMHELAQRIRRLASKEGE